MSDLKLPEGLKLFYYPRRNSWVVVLECHDPDLRGMKAISPSHIRTIMGLKDWIEERWPELENVVSLSQHNPQLMQYVINDLRAGNI